MARLVQAAGLTDVQTDILSTVRSFVDKEILLHAQRLEHDDIYPADIVDGMKEMGLFGLTIPEQYGGLGDTPRSSSTPTRTTPRRPAAVAAPSCSATR